MSGLLSVSAAQRLVDGWDAQQAAYVTQREARFAIMLDVLARLAEARGLSPESGDGLVVLDIACGPGSLSGRILDRFPAARVIGLDYDPVLLALAEAWLRGRHGVRFVAVDADLAAADWTDRVPALGLHAVVSSTALHWLAPGDLVSCYLAMGKLLPEGGVLLNADHLRYHPDRQPFLAAAAAYDDERTQREAHSRGVLTWDRWWKEATAHAELAQHAEERERRFAGRPPTPHAPLELHQSALVAAGFAETGTVWRLYDDVVVFARR